MLDNMANVGPTNARFSILKSTQLVNPSILWCFLLLLLQPLTPVALRYKGHLDRNIERPPRYNGYGLNNNNNNNNNSTTTNNNKNNNNNNNNNKSSLIHADLHLLGHHDNNNRASPYLVNINETQSEVDVHSRETETEIIDTNHDIIANNKEFLDRSQERVASYGSEVHLPWMSLAYLRPQRSPNDITGNGDKILPETCHLSPSCSKRNPQNVGEYDTDMRFPCRCDDDCENYGDCCYDFRRSLHTGGRDHSNERIPKEKMRNEGDDDDDERGKEENNGKRGGKERHRVNLLPQTVTQDSWTCRHLAPVTHGPHSSKKVVYMVNACPEQTPKQLADKCIQVLTVGDTQHYLMDIPVVSSTSDIVYANIFCAQCHKEYNIKEYSVHIICSDPAISLHGLINMTYHPGELMWTKKKLVMQTDLNRDNLHSQDKSAEEVDEISCSLDIIYDDSIGRDCELGVIKTCSNSWVTDAVRNQCSSYNYYVTVGSTIYKNWHCALCNNETESAIYCLPSYKNLRGLMGAPPSLQDLFRVKGECLENQVWNLLYNRCENVSCGSLFTLKEGECVRNNETVEDDGQSYLNSSCYTYEFQREYSIMFPNGSVYINHTMKTYNNGEYEFVNHTWIKVCRSEDTWTPVMNIISTVLISISLVCMVIHMMIFILLPKRRNIPSMNLFSMTLSLFITELVFVSLFYLNENYALCVFIAVIIYYFLSASFMWMNVMSIDICRTFHSKTYKTKSRKIFIQYSIYAWSVPMVTTIIALLIDQFASPESPLNPGFGTDRCWFNKKWGLVIFFTLPSGLIVFINLGLFGVSVYDIYKQHKSGELASSTVQKTGNNKLGKGKKRDGKEKEKFLKPKPYPEANSNQTKSTNSSDSDSPRCTERFRDRLQRRIHAHKKQRLRLVLYCKLAIIMGLTWIFAFISFHTQSMVFEYLFIIFNGLQGTFIFIAFDCKQKLWDEIWMRLTGKKIQRQDTGNSSRTRETALNSSTDGRYRYRWSSTRNQDGSRKSSPLSHGQDESFVTEKESSTSVR